MAVKNIGIGLAFLILLTSAGCGGVIRGSVYLDANDNGVQDANEGTIGKVPIKVTLEGKVVANPSTNLKGMFVAPLHETGYYCAEVMDPNLAHNLIQKMGRKLSKNAAGTFSYNTPFATGSKVLDNPLPGQPEPATGTAAENEDDKDKKDEEDEDKKEPAEEPKPSAPVFQDKVSSGIVCQNVKGFNWKVAVPVAISYENEIAQIRQSYDLGPFKSGETFNLDLPLPPGCSVQPLYLPKELEVVQTGGGVSVEPDLGRVDFSLSTAEPSYEIGLKVGQSPVAADKSIQLTPKVLCADGQILELATYNITLQLKPRIEIWQEPHPAKTKVGDLVTWKISVVNKGERRVESVKVIGELPTNAEVVNAGSSCSSPAYSKVECHTDLEADARAPTVFEVIIKFNSAGDTPTLYTLKASAVLASDEENPIKAEAGQVSVSRE